MEENNLNLAIANALTEALWMKGFLSDKEMAMVKEKNAESLSLNFHKKASGRNEESAVQSG